jgi:hypothetical protein
MGGSPLSGMSKPMKGDLLRKIEAYGENTSKR